jgi:transcriptional regulator with XRE-family HTH domain
MVRDQSEVRSPPRCCPGIGLSQEELAHRAGLDRSYMSGIERGVRNVTVLNLQSVARALKVPVRELLPED